VEAVRWFRKAAAHGSGAACDQLGRAYEYGAGVARDESIADSWYRLAIKAGYREAEQDLSALHRIARRPDSNAPKRAGGRSPEADFTF
jgi:TPR repeat protein